MPRPDKVAVVDEVQRDLTDAAATLLTNYRGLTVTELSELRTELRKAGATYKVVKNTLVRRAAAAAGMEGLDEFLVGPTALVFCGEDPVGPAKALKAFAKNHPELLVKAGYLDGEVLDEAATIRLADLESREELLAKLAGLMYGALAGFAQLMQAPLSQQVRLIQALVDDGGVEAKGFSPEAPAAPAADEAPAAEETEAAVEETAPDAPADEAPADEAPADEASDAADDDASGVVETATEAVETAVDTAADAAETVAEKAAEVVESAAETVADAAETVADAVGDAAEDGDAADDDA